MNNCGGNRSGRGDGRGGGGRGGGGRGRGGKGWNREGKGWRPKIKELSEGQKKNPIKVTFHQHAVELDERLKSYDRISKHSRDITLETKRILPILHRILGEEDKRDGLLEAERKLGWIRYHHWYYIARELFHQPEYKFIEAYSGGLQEYIKGLSFYHYSCYGTLISWEEVQKELTFVSMPKKKLRTTPDAKMSAGVKEVTADGEGAKKEEGVIGTEKPNEGAKEKMDEEKADGGEEGSTGDQVVKEGNTKEDGEGAGGGGDAKEDAEVKGGEEEGKKDEEDAEGQGQGKRVIKKDRGEKAKEREAENAGKEEENTEVEKEAKKGEEIKEGGGVVHLEGPNQDETEPKEDAAAAAGEAAVGLDPPGDKEGKEITDKAPVDKKIHVPLADYILGIVDLSGEIMRHSISMVDCGNVDGCFNNLNFLHALNEGFIRARGFPGDEQHKVMKEKFEVLSKAIAKVETMCCAIQLRGREFPNHLTASYVKEEEGKDAAAV